MPNTDGGFRRVLNKRYEILESLSDGPQTKPELINTISKSRSTIDRSINDLQQHNCVEKVEKGSYDITKKGEMALATYHSYKQRTTALSEAGDIINDISDDFEISYEFLNNMEAYPADLGVPEIALSRSNDIIKDSTKLRGLATTALSSYPDTLLEQATNNGLEIEIVASEELITTLTKLKKNTVEKLANHENVTILTTTEEIPESIWIAETPDGSYAGITVHSNGGVSGVLINNQKPALEWAEDIYLKYKETSSGKITLE